MNKHADFIQLTDRISLRLSVVITSVWSVRTTALCRNIYIHIYINLLTLTLLMNIFQWLDNIEHIWAQTVILLITSTIHMVSIDNQTFLFYCLVSNSYKCSISSIEIEIGKCYELTAVYCQATCPTYSRCLNNHEIESSAYQVRKIVCTKTEKHRVLFLERQETQRESQDQTDDFHLNGTDWVTKH